MIYVCKKCDEVCEIKSVIAGSHFDEYCGRKKCIIDYDRRTCCCNSEEFDEYTETDWDEMNHPGGEMEE